MRAENLKSTPRTANYLSTSLAICGFFAFLSGMYVAWPALAHLGSKVL